MLTFEQKLHREILLQQKDQYEARTHVSDLMQVGRAPTLNLFMSRFDGEHHSTLNYERYPWVSWMISNVCCPACTGALLHYRSGFTQCSQCDFTLKDDLS